MGKNTLETDHRANPVRSFASDATPRIPLITERVGLRWRDLAGRLGFSADDIDGIAASFRSYNYQACCRAMLEKWQQVQEDEGILKLQILKTALYEMMLQDVAHALQKQLDAVVMAQTALLMTAEFLSDNLDKDTVSHFLENRGVSSDQMSTSDLVGVLVDCIKTPEDYEELIQSFEKSGQAFLVKEIRTFEWF
ncbi:Hypp5403 [Branchiostoma lanceolatum]|uniref:Hypp5403 protein n=1 Tax=Branchiostoma lanceolatum TaxID=7740 RepID=A0A8K0AEX3_BRALA|nr:Hypp5403 [Branchiostoma lanceolatum]